MKILQGLYIYNQRFSKKGVMTWNLEDSANASPSHCIYDHSLKEKNLRFLLKNQTEIHLCICFTSQHGAQNKMLHSARPQQHMFKWQFSMKSHVHVCVCQAITFKTCTFKVKPLTYQGLRFNSAVWVASFSLHGSANCLKISHIGLMLWRKKPGERFARFAPVWHFAPNLLQL